MRTIRVDDEVYELVTRYARLWNQTPGHTTETLVRLHDQPEHTVVAPPPTAIEADSASAGEVPAVTANIALPKPIDPDERVIRFVQVECRCGEKSPVARDPMQDRQSNEAYDWHATHFDTTGHRDYYRWTLERGAGRAFRF
ncbi:hypothetical protein KIF24_17105 [Micromonospora sp. Llam7]|uniref:hypothetical protein n=1 Tax=Micromonospora tarapacensis TaxID=2835305 RepID=UPI001C8380E2|nr:hypothetical protein [Micromonospora tarapacensis]MBX7267582.1 hypothetical protein [Micromonospora tarapacensis]